MQLTMLGALLLAFLASHVAADCYMHNPRGSNNRYRTQNDNKNVENNARLFNSQNNDAGGYDNCRVSGTADTPLQFIAGSILPIQWAAQHACGKNSWVNCQIILQYMCGTDNGGTNPILTSVRDGTSNTQINFQDTGNTDDSNAGVGMHEDWYHYYSCKHRQRNKGLFTADQQVNGDDSDFTRQNPNANRRGYECQEERDYYPYWAPSPWVDVALLVDDTSKCNWYQKQSQNISPRYMCQQRTATVGTAYNPPRRMLASEGNGQTPLPINSQLCVALGNNYEWATVPSNLDRLGWKTNKNVPFWGGNDAAVRRECQEWKKAGDPNADAKCAEILGSPDCIETTWQRDNHLGVVLGGFLANYSWSVPDTPSTNCVLRIRYNISTDDYDPSIGSAYNENNNEKKTGKSPVEQNEYFKWAWDYVPLALALNTAQYGRTFQDRSHVFSIVSRTGTLTLMDGNPAGAAPVKLALADTDVVWNVNVRGKRGHYSQVYPSVPMDFVPQFLHIKQGDFVHFQWEGASTGVFSYFGGGLQRTERSNLVAIANMKSNWPLTGTEATKMFGGDANLQTYFATAGQNVLHGLSTGGGCKSRDSLLYQTIQPVYNDAGDQPTRWTALAKLREQAQNCAWLNLARPTFFAAPIKFSQTGTFYYMSTRNNAPGIQSHKGVIYVE